MSRPTVKFWFGMTLAAWFRLLRRHRFAVGPAAPQLVLAGMTTFLSAAVNTLPAAVQRLRFGRRIAATPLADDPLFIIGHWRSGTTLLHELLALDERFLWPTTYECFAPGHFLVSRPLMTALKPLLPPRRPMDRMRIGFDKPQEDEIALLLMGEGTPYEAMAFPNHRPAGEAYLRLDTLDDARREAWQRRFRRFLQAIQLRALRDAGGAPAATRLLLKSPPHTARIPLLRAMFPKARFVHLLREPAALYASTVKFWTAVFATEGLQTLEPGTLPGGGPSIEEYVLRNLPLLYRHFAADRAALPAGDFYELRFDDLIRRPMAELEGLYAHLGLALTPALRARIEAYLAGIDYGAERYREAPDIDAVIAERWPLYTALYRCASDRAAREEAAIR
jgi:hypothetical protein